MDHHNPASELWGEMGQIANTKQEESLLAGTVLALVIYHSAALSQLSRAGEDRLDACFPHLHHQESL